MDDVIGYARTFFIGGTYRAPLLPDLASLSRIFTRCWRTWRGISISAPSFAESRLWRAFGSGAQRALSLSLTQLGREERLDSAFGVLRRRTVGIDRLSRLARVIEVVRRALIENPV